MNLDTIIAGLKEERGRIDAALKALGGEVNPKAGKTKRHVSAKSRRKMAAAQKARWAKIKSKK